MVVVFRVPATRDMVTALLNPKEKKSFFDLLTLGAMGIEAALFFFLPTWLKQPLFIVIFLFWRLAYNAGLGVLLKYQSDSKGLVRLATQYKIFDKEANPKMYRWLQVQLSMKMGEDYDFAVGWMSDCTEWGETDRIFCCRRLRLSTTPGCSTASWST